MRSGWPDGDSKFTTSLEYFPAKRRVLPVGLGKRKINNGGFYLSSLHVPKCSFHVGCK